MFLTENQVMNITANYLYHHGPASTEEIFEIVEKMEELLIATVLFDEIMGKRIGIAGIRDNDLTVVPFGIKMEEQ
jgi:hypothetical protein